MILTSYWEEPNYNNKLTTSAHKTEELNRTKIMRFYPFVSTGKERDEETGYGYFGARYMDHELLAGWLSVDRYASKYPFISPYAYCAWNPIRLIDPHGDSIMVCPQYREEGNKKLLSSLSEKTGLKLYVNENGRMLYEKDEYGNPIVNGGSSTAREDLKNAIGDNEFKIIVQYKNGDASIDGAASDRRALESYASRLFVDIADFSGMEHKTFDIGMVFLHEFQHGYFGLSDNVNKLAEIYSSRDPYYYKTGYRGDVVDKVNVYRKELGLPTREAYMSSPFTKKVPFFDGGKTLWLDGYKK